MKPFRFMTSLPGLGDVSTWRDRVRRIEDLGFDTVAISDHLTGGWSMDPVVAMTVAAEATTRLRVATVVLANPLRHPVLVHRALANLDVFSGGRVEIGIGAGWQRADHDAVGIELDPPGVRLERLEESLELLLALFRGERIEHQGKYYRASGVDGVPAPVQRPHPPLLVGGGGQRVLTLAGRLADIAGITLQQSTDGVLARHHQEQTVDRLAQKVEWVRAGARAAGRDPAEVELQLSMVRVRVSVGGAAHEWRSSLGAGETPGFATLDGDVDHCVDTLLRLREEHGVSYIHLGNNLDAVAPIVAAMAGR